MTKDDLKTCLNEYNSAMRIVDTLIDEKNKYLTMATKITPSYAQTPKSKGGSDKVQTYPEKIEEIEQQLVEEIINSKATLLKVMRLIRTVSNTQFREMLILKYIKGYTLHEIASKTNYSYKQACRIHGYALDSIKISKDVLECP